MFWRCEAVLFYIVLCCMKLYEVLQKCSKYQQFQISSDFINLRAWSWRLRSPSLPSLPSLRYRRSHSCGSARRDRRWSRHRNTHSHWQSGCPRGRQGSCDGILQQEWSAWIAMVLLWCCYGAVTSLRVCSPTHSLRCPFFSRADTDVELLVAALSWARWAWWARWARGSWESRLRQDTATAALTVHHL